MLLSGSGLELPTWLLVLGPILLEDGNLPGYLVTDLHVYDHDHDVGYIVAAGGALKPISGWKVVVITTTVARLLSPSLLTRISG